MLYKIFWHFQIISSYDASYSKSFLKTKQYLYLDMCTYAFVHACVSIWILYWDIVQILIQLCSLVLFLIGVESSFSISRWFLIFFLPFSFLGRQTWHFSGFISGFMLRDQSLLVGLKGPNGMSRIEPGQPCARRTPYSLNYCSTLFAFV